MPMLNPNAYPYFICFSFDRYAHRQSYIVIHFGIEFCKLNAEPQQFLFNALILQTFSHFHTYIERTSRTHLHTCIHTLNEIEEEIRIFPWNKNSIRTTTQTKTNALIRIAKHKLHVFHFTLIWREIRKKKIWTDLTYASTLLHKK